MIIPIGDTTKKKITPITKGDTIIPKKIPRIGVPFSATSLTQQAWALVLFKLLPV